MEDTIMTTDTRGFTGVYDAAGHINAVRDYLYDGALMRERSARLVIEGPPAPRRSLTATQVREIRAIYQPRVPGRNLAALAEQYDVHPSTIWDVVNDVTYRDVSNAAL